MPSTNLNTTNFGTAQGAGTVGTIRLRSGGAANQPGVLQLDSVNDSATVATNYLWFDHLGRLRAHSSYPTDQDSSGRDVTASLSAGSIGSLELGTGVVSSTKLGNAAVMTSHFAGGAVNTAAMGTGSITAVKIRANTVTPGTMSASASELSVMVDFLSLTAGTDVSNRIVYRTSAVTSLNRGTAYLMMTNRQSMTAGETMTIGLGTAAAFDLFLYNATVTLAAGSIVSMTAGSQATVPVSTSVRFDETNSAASSGRSGTILWYPRKRGSN